MKSVNRNPQSSEVEITFNSTITTSISPETLAKIFWEMDDRQQTRFLNTLAVIAEHKIVFQLQSITDNPNLSLEARIMMEQFGEYARPL